MKTSLFVEYQGLQVNEKDIIAGIKEIWINEGNKIKDIKDLKLYVKPEEFMAYYVINDDISGKIELK
ncbi:DUF6465 family protein [Frisingicoccus sp.]|uniref:DUF6465 family protein n=1 Tax=Frisingicoccus sp. TaxID=1918627 RepID=UPI003AB3648F